MKINGEKLKQEYEKTPSLRILAKKYKCSTNTIKKYFLKAGGKFNFKKGNPKNYKANKGSFKTGMIPWNKNKKMNKKFREMRREIMKQQIKKGIYIPISQRPGVAKKISKSKKGNKNPAWKGGIAKKNVRTRNNSMNKQWRKKVLNRDNYICKRCGKVGENLNAHHIKSVVKYPELINDVNNGITLCKKCHYETYKKEKQFEKCFKNILEGFKVITITSTRPCLLRQSLIIKILDKFLGKNHVHVYTGQNYDNNLYHIFLKDLKLRKPNYEFNLNEKFRGYKFLGLCAINIENLLKNFNKNNTLINILGDVDGAFISTYVATRMGFKVIHNESGNRSGENILEEINRKSIDTMAYKLLCYTQRNRENLLKEGYDPHKIIVTGNPLTEVLNKYFDKNCSPLRKDKYILVTLHRHETINSFERLEKITTALKILSKEYKIIISLHPSLKDKIKKNVYIEKLFLHKNIELHCPFNYTTFLNLMNYSSIFLSDSGGECEEASILSVPCLVLRNETERNELFEYSQMILCGIETEDIIRNAKVIKELPLSGIPEEYKKPTSSIVVKILLGK